MDFRIEVGTDEQRKLIRIEMSVLQHVAEDLGILGTITEVIVPRCFEKTIQELAQDTSFAENRGYHQVMAKIVEIGNGTAIVIAPWLFTEGFDTQIRIGVYVHEIAHVWNRQRFPNRQGETPAEAYYGENLYTLFDEYAAERFSLETCARFFDEPTGLCQEHRESLFWSFLDDLDDQTSYNVLFNAAGAVRLGLMDVGHYQETLQPVFDRSSKALIYAASYIDSTTTFGDHRDDLRAKRLVGDAALRLVEYFRHKYEAADYDLCDGLSTMKEYIASLGFVIEDVAEGLYCRIVGVSL